MKSSYAARASGLTGNAVTGPAVAAVKKARHRRKPAPPAPVYLNPLRAVAGLMPQRIDMGVDFAGSGPVYPIGNAVITSATATSAGWPGGGWITYQLTNGPAAGLVVYVAEDVQPTATVGENVTPTTAIATMFNGSAGIETGWAMPDSSSAESQLAAAGGISGAGPFPTAVGVNFDELLQALGVPGSVKRGPGGQWPGAVELPGELGGPRLAAATPLSKRGRRSPACRTPTCHRIARTCQSRLRHPEARNEASRQSRL